MNEADDRTGSAATVAPPRRERIETNNLVVRVEGLERSYGEHPAVRGITLDVHRGEVFGILGPNGAGKTTTIEVLAGFRHRDRGDVSVLGLDPGRRDELRMLRRRAAIVPQAAGHYRYLTVRETLEMHHALHVGPRDVEDVLQLVGLDDVGMREVRRLSGGQQRRLDVGVAIIGRPEIVLLDEPTTGFDPAARRRAWELIAQLRDLGTTVLLCTHYMEEAQELCDRVAVMARGRIVGIGAPAELAEQLRLPARISFRLPPSASLADLPLGAAGAIADVVDESGMVGITTAEPTRVMSMICGWASGVGLELELLELRQPGLEESYLALTSVEEDA